jgi:hypothetical protein
MQNFTFHEIVEFLQSGNNKTKEQAEKEFADWLAKNDKFHLVPDEVAQRLFDETAISTAKDLLLMANIEVLNEYSVTAKEAGENLSNFATVLQKKQYKIGELTQIQKHLLEMGKIIAEQFSEAIEKNSKQTK